jgi:hypothetical protein
MPSSTTQFKPAQMPAATRRAEHHVRVLPDLFVWDGFVDLWTSVSRRDR